MKNSTILIVDDEERNIKLMKAMLGSENYHLLEALSGLEALKIVANTCPDLILLDIMMPGMNGFEVCRQIKNEETRIIPIVMVTSLREKEHSVKAMEAGADDFLSKPVDETELMVRVKSLLRIKSYHDDLADSHRELAEKNQKLRNLERLKEGLTHMIIHDFRNPLMAISGGLELLSMNKASFSENQRRTMERCTEYCYEIDQMIQSLLDIHKIEEGKLKPKKEVTDPIRLIEDIFDLFLLKAKSEQIALSCIKPEDIPCIRIDPVLIKRVIANLLSNAIRNTPEGGKIDVILDTVSDKASFCFSVRDNGNGLSPEYHQKIFDKFEQVELKQRGATAGGSGLGLAFCKMVVEAHGGRIWVESEGEGKGCTFSFTVRM